MPCLNNPVSWKRLNSVFSDVEPEAQSSAGASCGYWTGSAGRVGVTLLLTPTAPVPVSETFTCERRCCRGMPRQALEQRVLPVIFPAGSDPRDPLVFEVLRAGRGESVFEAACHKSLSLLQLCRTPPGHCSCRHSPGRGRGAAMGHKRARSHRAGNFFCPRSRFSGCVCFRQLAKQPC